MTLRFWRVLGALSLGVTPSGCGVPFLGASGASITLTSEAFTEGQPIPTEFTCDGGDASPPLAWSPTPPGTQRYALIVDDPISRDTAYVHWVLYDLPGSETALPTNMPKGESLPNGAKQGKNYQESIGYSGPCPPRGQRRPHTYHFKLYALDTPLNLNPGATKEQVLEAMNGHILGQGELTGTYIRP